MAKTKPTEPSTATKATAKAEAKAERKAAKQARKVEKLAKKGGVTKSSKKDKEGKEKRKVLAERALNEIEGSTEKEEGEEDEDESEEEGEGEMDVSGVKSAADEEEEASEEEEEDIKMNGASAESEEDEKPVKKDRSAADKKRKLDLASRPIGALVPFANPLADEKVAKKVFKSVKKGMRDPLSSLHLPSFRKLIPSSRRASHPKTRRQRSRQSAPQIPPIHTLRLDPPHRHRHPRRRHLPHGRDQPHPRPRRRPQYPIHLRDQPGGVGYCGHDEAAD